jgi:predicted MFS family arabinose efflux permease
MIVLFGTFGLIQAQEAPNRTALMRDAVPPERMTGAISLFHLTMSCALLFAAPFAGFAIERFGIATAYSLAALGPLAVLIVAFRLRVGIEAADIEGRSASFMENLRGGFRVLRDEPVVRWTVLLSWIATACGLSIMGVLVAAWVRGVLGLDARGWGLMALCWGAGSLVSTLYLTWRGDFRRKGALFLGAAFLFGVSILGFSLSRSIPLAFLFNGLAGLCFMLYQTTGLAIVAAAVPNRLLGRVTGLLLLGGGLMQVSALGLGALAQVAGIEAVYVAAASTIIVATAAVALIQAPLRRFD